MSRKPSRGWDATSHESLLMAFIDEIKPNKAIIQNVTQRMTAMGYSYTYDAINQHVQKLKKNREAAPQGDGTVTPTKTPTTPAKRSASGKKKSAKQMKEDISDDDPIPKLEFPDELLMDTPSKRAKTKTAMKEAWEF
ncbi:hypothetical protein B0I35DRAFT_459816 [Stachybotrys elegans]|uniref:Uncharacterized protein n=1 Tax=Stachybotrys elegans TaxID=80388 RepID=A0A8K0WTH1_9HYPO|nr:hypothetical protein B0I35DRAFT_459816 [Stachybotrys elegans]